MDEIDMRLQQVFYFIILTCYNSNNGFVFSQLEKDIDAQKPDEIEVEAMLKKAKIIETQLMQTASNQDNLLIDIESEQHNNDTLSSTSSEPVVQANTSPKTLILSPSAPPAPKTVVSIPCIMCDQVS